MTNSGRFSLGPTGKQSRMSSPLLARIAGAFLILFGVAGFVPWIAPAAPFDAPVLSIDIGYRILAGIFPVNVVSNGVDILFGIAGLLAALSFTGAVVWCRITAWWLVLLLLFGLIPITNTLFGIAPLYGNDLLLNGVFSLVALFGGYGRPSLVEVEELLQPS